MGTVVRRHTAVTPASTPMVWGICESGGDVRKWCEGVKLGGTHAHIGDPLKAIYTSAADLYF